MADPATPRPLYGRALIGAILSDASRGAGIGVSDIWGPTREKDVVRVRQAVVWVARTVLATPWSRIAAALMRDHSTIIQAFGRAERLRGADPAFRHFTDRLADRARERSTLS